MSENLTVFKNKNILVCVTGSIAAYKACDIIRILTKEGANVKVAMSESAQKFITPLTFASITKNDVITELFSDEGEKALEHVEISFKIDAICVIPATANIISKAANGVADDLISTLLLICEQPTVFIPAMNYKMWQNKTTIDSVEKLKNLGKKIIYPEEGYLASLHKGEGRLSKNINVINALRKLFKKKLPLENKNVLVTAGPTRELIDPVRYISNFSSGKMGFSLAQSSFNMGANVFLISGPTNLQEIPGVNTVFINSADEMYNEVVNILANNAIDLLFMNAAVCDYSPNAIKDKKIKDKKHKINLELIPNKDIIKEITKNFKGFKSVGFSLEGENGEKEAIRKLKDKNLDYIILNRYDIEDIGFNSNYNEVTIFSKKNKIIQLNKDRKDRLATQIIDYIIKN